MKYNNTPLWIQQANWHEQYRIDQHSGDKELEVASFLVHHISPMTNDYHFTIKNIMNHFNCSRSTVYRVIKALKKTNTVNIVNGHIKFKQYTPINSLGGDTNDNK